MSASQFIAAVGQSPIFIAFQAHCWFAFAVITVLPHWWTVALCLALALLKEFWFDIRYESDQTDADGALDFAGYAAGIFLGTWHAGLVHFFK